MDYVKLFYTGGNFHTEPTDAISAPLVFLNEAIPLPTEYQLETYTPEVAPIDATSVQTAKLPETKQLPKVASHLRKLQLQYPELTEELLQAKYDELSTLLQTNAQLVQGRTQKKTPIEEQQSKLKEKLVAVQKLAQINAEKKAKAMLAALAMLEFISPSTWVEVMGNVDMTGAQELLADIFLDPTTYLSAGTIPLLKVASKESAEKILKEAAERGLRKGTKSLSKNSQNLILSTGVNDAYDALKYFSPKLPPKDLKLVILINLAQKLKDTESIEKLVLYVRGMPISKTEQDLILWRSLPIEKLGDIRALPIAGYELSTIYNGNKYLERLKRAGFTEQEAKERIASLTENMRLAVRNKPTVSIEDGNTLGISHVDLTHPPYIELSKNKASLNAQYNAAVEEMAHASHYNGVILPEHIIQAQSTIKSPIPINPSDDPLIITMRNKINDLIQEHNEAVPHFIRLANLHNDKAVEFNKKLLPELTDVAKRGNADYYLDEDEIRVRMHRAQAAINAWHKYGISPTAEDLEYFLLYKDPQLKYFNNALLAPAAVTTATTPYLLNYQTKSNGHETKLSTK